MVYKASRNIEKNVKVGIVRNHIASQGLLRQNINPNIVHQESRNCSTRDPENVAKTRAQSVLSVILIFTVIMMKCCVLLRNRVMEMVNKKNKRTLEH